MLTQASVTMMEKLFIDFSKSHPLPRRTKGNVAHIFPVPAWQDLMSYSYAVPMAIRVERNDWCEVLYGWPALNTRRTEFPAFSTTSKTFVRLPPYPPRTKFEVYVHRGTATIRQVRNTTHAEP